MLRDKMIDALLLGLLVVMTFYAGCAFGVFFANWSLAEEHAMRVLREAALPKSDTGKEAE